MSTASASVLAQLAQPVPLKFNYSTKEAVAAFGSFALFRRLRFHGWLKPIRKFGKTSSALYPVTNLLEVQKRLEGGEAPPLLPSEMPGAIRTPRRPKAEPKKSKGKARVQAAAQNQEETRHAA